MLACSNAVRMAIAKNSQTCFSLGITLHLPLSKSDSRLNPTLIYSRIKEYAYINNSENTHSVAD